MTETLSQQVLVEYSEAFSMYDFQGNGTVDVDKLDLVLKTLGVSVPSATLMALQQKKFEEGIFSDLRNLKPGNGAVLEEPRSKFLDFLFKLNCIRTHKKQKVFLWRAVQVPFFF